MDCANRRKKSAFSNKNGYVWTGPKTSAISTYNRIFGSEETKRIPLIWLIVNQNTLAFVSLFACIFFKNGAQSKRFVCTLC